MTKLIKDKNFFQITCEKKSIVELENGGIQIEGYASTKDKDRGSDIVEPTAFKSALEEYMTNPIVLLQHNMEKPVGIVTDATIDSKGLYIKANITEDEDGIFSKLKNGVIRAFSIGYRIKDFEDKQVKNEKGDCVGFETIIKDLELFEISLVSIPMNQYALMKSMQDCFEMEEKENEEIVAEETDDGSIVVEVKENEENVEEEKQNDEEIEQENASELDEEKSDEETQEQVEQESKEETNDAEISSEIEEKSIEGSENQNADEQSEIVEKSDESDDSENVVETTTNEETSGETNAGTIVEKAVNLKELSTKSMEMFIDGKFESMQKAFEEKIQQKDMEIESLKKNFNKQTEILAKFAECLEEMDQKMKTTIVSGYAFQKADKPRTAYSNIVENLQKM